MVLTGALTAIACICVDLADPFGGAFQITPSAEQIYSIREVVDQTLCDVEGCSVESERAHKRASYEEGVYVR